MKIIFILLLIAIIGSWSTPQTPSTTRTSTIARSTATMSTTTSTSRPTTTTKTTTKSTTSTTTKSTTSTTKKSTTSTTTKSTTSTTTKSTTSTTTKSTSTTTRSTTTTTTSTTTCTCTPSTTTCSTTVGPMRRNYAVLIGGIGGTYNGIDFTSVNPSVQVWYHSTSSPCQTSPSIPNLPEKVYSNAAAVLGNMIMNCGGRKVTDDQITNACYSYTVGSAGATWVSAPAMVKTRYDHTMTAVNNIIVVTGGVSPVSPPVYPPVSTVEVFTNGGWQEMLGWNMPKERFFHCAVKYGGNNVVVTGGFVDGLFSNTVEKLNTAIGTWTTMASMNQDRHHHSCVSYEQGATEYIVVAGGRGGVSSSILSTVEQFSSATNAWVLLTSMNSPRERHSMGMLDGLITVMGGVNSNYAVLTETEYLESGYGTVWKYGKNLQFIRADHAMVTLPCV